MLVNYPRIIRDSVNTGSAAKSYSTTFPTCIRIDYDFPLLYHLLRCRQTPFFFCPLVCHLSVLFLSEQPRTLQFSASKKYSRRLHKLNSTTERYVIKIHATINFVFTFWLRTSNLVPKFPTKSFHFPLHSRILVIFP